MRLLDQRTGDHGTVLQHILQIDQIAIVHMLCKIVHVVEVDQPLIVRFDDLRRQQQPPGDVLGNFPGHVVALDTVDGRILIGIFLLDLLIVALEQAHDLIVGGVCLADQIAHIPVGNVFFGDFEGAGLHDSGLDDILNFLDRQRPIESLADAGNVLANRLYLLCRQCVLEFHCLIGLRHRGQNFGDGEIFLRPASLYDFHALITISCVNTINIFHMLCFLKYIILTKIQLHKLFFCKERHGNSSFRCSFHPLTGQFSMDDCCKASSIRHCPAIFHLRCSN